MGPGRDTARGEDVPLAGMAPSLLPARAAPSPEPFPSGGSSSGTIPALNVTETQQELPVMCLPLIFSSGVSRLREILCKRSQLSHLLSPDPTAGFCHVAPADHASMLALLWPYLLQLPRACGDTSHDLPC